MEGSALDPVRPLSPEVRVALALGGLLTAVKLGLAGHWPLIADEAYYWVWSLDPALGYYDQPPLIAWLIAATTALGDHEVLVRLGAVLCGLLAPLALLTVSGDRPRMLLWWAGVPPLLWLTWFATPDASLLLFWALTLVAAIKGRWPLAGLFAGLAFLSKYSGLAVLPLCLMALPEDRRRSWVAIPVAAVVALPNLLWNAQHDWVSFGFQLREGLVHPDAPGWTGPLEQIVDQLLVVTPLAFAAGLAWLVRFRGGNRTERVAFWTSAPVLVFFALAALGGPPEAHWAAPAWIGAGLGLTWASGRLARLAEVGGWLGLLLSALLALHAVVPVLKLPDDPGTRLTEGPVVASWVDTWHEGEPVLTERYQEAAFVHYYAGIPARKLSGCGRADQYDLEPFDPPEEALMLRPARSGDALCSDPIYPDREEGGLLKGYDRFDRPVGRWQLYRVSR